MDVAAKIRKWKGAQQSGCGRAERKNVRLKSGSVDTADSGRFGGSVLHPSAGGCCPRVPVHPVTRSLLFFAAAVFSSASMFVNEGSSAALLRRSLFGNCRGRRSHLPTARMAWCEQPTLLPLCEQLKCEPSFSSATTFLRLRGASSRGAES